MKKIIIALLLLSYTTNFSQIINPVKWKTNIEKNAETEFTLVFNAVIEPKWHIYSQFSPDGGSLPAVFTFKKGNYSLTGKTIESNYKKVYSDVFEVDEYLFENKATFKQKIKITNANTKTIQVKLEYQACKEACIQLEENFTFNLPIATKVEEKTTITDTLAKTKKTITKQDTLSLNKTANTNNANLFLYGIEPQNITKIKSIGNKVESKDENSKKSLFSIFGLGFIGGLLALLTPCVFPMIPLTVSFFTKSSGQNNKSGIWKAILYGLFILGVYLLLSIPFHLLDSINPDILNEISTNIWLNVAFFVIFIFFAFSFFGFYELTLPSSWTNKTTQGENIGGILGIFFMALTLAIVSFSCTGPILGSLLAGSLTADGGAWQLTAGMAGFGLALGLPFALFAMFPNMLNALPKSGGWLNTTKVVLGFLELALAFKFLSNADLVKHWGILKYETFMILWIIIFAGLAIYLFGKIKFPHDSPIKKLSFFRLAFAVLVASFTIYLVSGFRVNTETKSYNSLHLLSGLAPPTGYSYGFPNNCPNNILCFKDLKTGLQYAKKNNKPVLLDFTGFACVNCRKMEEQVWSNPLIDKILRNEVVLISLYVDNKENLPKNEQIEVNRINGGTRILENYGHKWAHFQTLFFASNSQPFYVLFNPKTNQILNEPAAYMPNVDDYKNWLESGIKKYN